MRYGPKPTKLNWEQVEKLISYQSTQEEVAHFFNISVDCLERCCERDLNCTLPELWAKKRAMGRVKLRKIQFEIAEGKGPGAVAMAIFLGKRMLGQDLPVEDESSGQKSSAKEIPQKRTFEEFCEKAGYPKPFPKQLEIKDFVLNETEPRLLLGARGYGKTDYGTSMGVAYDIYLNGIFTTNLIITKSRTRNAAILDEIANALEKNGIALEKKNSTLIRVDGMHGKDHSVEAITIKSSMRGRHPKRIVMDDPVTDEDVSEAMRTLVKRKYDEASKLCKNIVIIGQPAHAFDLFAELRDKLKLLEIPHGSIPELDADLDAMRLAGVDEISIQMSYHLKIPADGVSTFSNLRFIDQLPTGDSVAFIDPSDGGDYTAISIGKAFMDGVAIEGHAWKKAWYHCLDDIVPILKARGVKKLCFETNCTGRQPIIQLQNLLGPLGIGVVGKHSDTNKHAVITSAGSYSHMIHLSKASSPVYTSQVVKYEHNSKYDDSPDSMARLLEWIGLIRGKK